MIVANLKAFERLTFHLGGGWSIHLYAKSRLIKNQAALLIGCYKMNPGISAHRQCARHRSHDHSVP